MHTPHTGQVHQRHGLPDGGHPVARGQQQQVRLQRAEGDLQPVPEAVAEVLQADRLGAGVTLIPLGVEGVSLPV